MSVATRALAAAGLLFVVYQLNLRAIGSRDTLVTEYVALSLAAHGDADLDEFAALHATGLAKGYLQWHGGHIRSNYPLVPAVVAAPVYWLAVRMGVIDVAHADTARLEAAGKIVASLLVAAACGLLFLLVREWLPGAPAFLVAVSAGLATPLWSSASQALWSHGAASLFLGLGLTWVGSRRPARRSALAAGVALGLAAACRPLLLAVPAGTALGLWRTDRRAANAWCLAVGCGGALGMLAAYNYHAFGTPLGGQAALESAAVHLGTHHVDSPWSGRLLDGLLGILVSPSRGLLIYAPIVVFSLPGAFRLWRTQPLLRWGIVMPSVVYLLGWAGYAVWWGGHSFGPRYASDLVIPLAIMTAAGVWKNAQPGTAEAVPHRDGSWGPDGTMALAPNRTVPSLLDGSLSLGPDRNILPEADRGIAQGRDDRSVRPPHRRAGVSRTLAALLLVWSIGVQAVGAFCYPGGEWNGTPADVDRAHARLWDWRDPQIVRTLGAGLFTPRWVRHPRDGRGLASEPGPDHH